MSAAPVDTSLGSLRLRIDPTAAHQLRTIRAITGDRTLSAAIHRVIFDAYMALPSAHSVDAGELPPDRPEGGPGQGTAASTPAPTTFQTNAVAVVLPRSEWPLFAPPGMLQAPESFVDLTTTLPPACDTCGERSEHEVCP